jgi:hypothetical protein
MSIILVECPFDPPTTADDLRAARAMVENCLLIREVTIHAVYLADNGRRAIYVLDGRDADSARNAFRSAGVAFERAWSATLLPART